MGDSLNDIKAIALQMEMDGVKLYSDLANKTFHPIGKAMFRSFVEDEKSHIKRIQTLFSSQKEAPPTKEKAGVNVKGRLNSIIQEMAGELEKKVDVNTNDIGAVRLAIEVEERGKDFYERAAGEAKDTVEGDTFHFLAEEEKTHLAILKNTLEYLESAEVREAEKEGRIYDVWMDKINKAK